MSIGAVLVVKSLVGKLQCKAHSLDNEILKFENSHAIFEMLRFFFVETTT